MSEWSAASSRNGWEGEMAAINERVKRDRWDVSLELINGISASCRSGSTP